MLYEELLTKLKEKADGKYAEFHGRLLKNENIKLIGVRIPELRKIAKLFKGDEETLLAFPDEYYEVTFIKLTAVSMLGYENFIKYIDYCVSLLDNWATCDCVSAKCITEHKDDFLPYIRKYAAAEGEYFQRFALVSLLNYYVEEKYAETIYAIVERCDTSLYYVHMAAAWLIAEMLVKHYESAVGFLSEHSLDRKTHNKAIQKACESFRLSGDRKNYLKGIKR